MGTSATSTSVTRTATRRDKQEPPIQAAISLRAMVTPGSHLSSETKYSRLERVLQLYSFQSPHALAEGM